MWYCEPFLLIQQYNIENVASSQKCQVGRARQYCFFVMVASGWWHQDDCISMVALGWQCWDVSAQMVVAGFLCQQICDGIIWMGASRWYHQEGSIRMLLLGSFCLPIILNFFLTIYFFMFSSFTGKSTNCDVSALLVALGCQHWDCSIWHLALGWKLGMVVSGWQYHYHFFL